MGRRRAIFAMVFGVVLLAVGIGWMFQLGAGVPLKVASTPKVLHTMSSVCSDTPPLDISHTKNPQLLKLNEYQTACHSFVTSTLMTFTGLPTTTAGAASAATDMAQTLHDFAAAGVRPLVVAEPSKNDGSDIDFARLADGSYDSSLRAYFSKLKALGITTQQMGIWNPLPEPNLPYWNNNQTQYFAPVITRYASIAREYFADLPISILLNSATFDTQDVNWQNGHFVSLTPFIQGIPAGVVTYVGLQGFPWVAPKGDTHALYNAADFLNPDLVTQIATKLGTKNVWFNTGTFGTRYAQDASRVVHVDAEQRDQILHTVLAQVDVLKDKGYAVSVNIFAQDKSRQTEETDWSYWAPNKPFNSDATPVLTEFVHSLNQKKVDLWLFDS